VNAPTKTGVLSTSVTNKACVPGKKLPLGTSFRIKTGPASSEIEPVHESGVPLLFLRSYMT